MTTEIRSQPSATQPAVPQTPIYVPAPATPVAPSSPMVSPGGGSSGTWSEGRFDFVQKQITFTSIGNCDEPTVGGIGETLAFICDQTGSPEVYTASVVIDDTDAVIISGPTPLTSTPGATEAHPAVNSFATVLFFQSTANTLDPTGSNADGSPETFMKDLPTGPTVQLTNYPLPGVIGPLPTPNPAGRASQAGSDELGEVVVFSSTTNSLSSPNTPPGAIDNPELNPEIFLYDRLDNRYHQLTHTPTGVNNLHPVIDAQAKTVVYVSNGDELSTNPDRNYEVFIVSMAESIPPCVDDPTTPEDECCVDDLGTTIDECCIDSNPSDGLNECDTCDPAVGGDLYNPGCPCDVDDTQPICLSAGNTPPTFTEPASATVTVDEGTRLAVNITATDPDLGDFLQLNKGTLPAGATFSCTIDDEPDGICDTEYKDTDGDGFDDFLQASGRLSWNVPFGQGGRSVSVDFTVNDGANPDVTLTLVITINKVNRPPTISVSPATQTVRFGKAINPIQITASDPDGDPLNFTVTGVPGGATQTPPVTSGNSVRSTVTWTPQFADIGTHTITATVDDGTTSKQATGKIEVVDNRAPNISVGDTTVAEFTCLSLFVSATDPDGDQLTYGLDAATLPEGSVWLGGSHTLHWHPGHDDPTGNYVLTGSRREITVLFKASDNGDTTPPCPASPGPTDHLICKPVKITVTDTPLDGSVIFGSAIPTVSATAGAVIPISFTVRNSGYSTWTAADGYALTPSYVALGMTATATPLSPTETIAPGSYATFTMNVRVPTKSGYHLFNTKMSHNGQPFGAASPYVYIQVK